MSFINNGYSLAQLSMLLPASKHRFDTTVTSDGIFRVSDGVSWNSVIATASSTWAARGSGAVVGDSKIITDIGPVGGSLFVWDGTYWRLDSPTLLLNTGLATGIAGTSEQILKQITLPAGLLRAARLICVRGEFERTGSTDAATCKLRIGSAGTTADTQVWSHTDLNAGQVAYPFESWFELTTSTNLRSMGYGDGQSGWFAGATAVAQPHNNAVANVDSNAIIISPTITMAGSTDLSRMRSLFVELIP